ncbi:MAG: restriction endonuclease subunit S [Methylococcaceae bacterium]|nr:restriction endonuclease subunit S [Methylococcaceae bacterium]
MVHSQQFSKLELMQGRVKFIPDNWKLMHIEKAYNIRNNLRLPINGTDRGSNPGPYPYYGPTRIQGYIGSYEQDGDFVLIGEDGDHFLKYKWQVMTQLVEGKCTVNNHAHILEETDVAIREWFYYYFMHRDIFSFLTRQGAGRFKLNKAALAKLPVLIPPHPEQKKIAKILSTWDKAITTTEQLIANSQQQKKALMQQLLTGKKRLAGFSGEWEEVKLEDCFDHIGGTALEKFVTKDGTHHFISIGNYSKGGKYIDKGQRIEFNTKTGTKLLSKNNLVMVLNDKTKTGDIIGSTILINEDDKYIFNQRSEKLITKNNVLPIFLWYLLNSIYIRAEVFKRSQGGTQIYVNFSSVKLIPCLIPTIKEQQKIAQVLSNADQEIETLQQKLSFLKEEKKALMQQLLTGKRRVKV